MKFAKTVLWVVAIGADIGGLAYLFAPATMLDLAGITATPGGLTDVRAVYGGMQLGLAAFLYWSVQAEERVQSGLVLAFAMIGAVGACRAIGLAVDQAPNAFQLGSLAVEITAAGFLVAAMRKLGSRDESHQPLGAVVQKAA